MVRVGPICCQITETASVPLVRCNNNVTDPCNFFLWFCSSSCPCWTVLPMVPQRTFVPGKSKVLLISWVFKLNHSLMWLKSKIKCVRVCHFWPSCIKDPPPSPACTVIHCQHCSTDMNSYEVCTWHVKITAQLQSKSMVHRSEMFFLGGRNSLKVLVFVWPLISGSVLSEWLLVSWHFPARLEVDDQMSANRVQADGELCFSLSVSKKIKKWSCQYI